MTTWVLPSRRQLISFFAFFLMLLALNLPLLAAGPAPAQNGTSVPRIWLSEPQAVTVNHVSGLTSPVGSWSTKAPVAANLGRAISLNSGDFSGAGIPDLVVGYRGPQSSSIAIHRGNLEAFAPQSEAAAQAIGRGEFPSPFLTDAQVIGVPVSPDFIATGNFAGNGHTDIAFAARGGTLLYVLPGDGKGNFGSLQTISLPAAVTALASGDFGHGDGVGTILVGLAASPRAAALAIFRGNYQGLSIAASIPLSAPATGIAFGELDGDNMPDAAILAGGKVFVLHSSTLILEDTQLSVSATAIAVGSFIFDRLSGQQIAVLGSNGTLSIAALSDIDSRPLSNEEVRLNRRAHVNAQPSPLNLTRIGTAPGWKIVENIPGLAPFSPTQAPVLFRTRISSSGADDVMVINPSHGEMSVVSHPDQPQGSTTFFPAEVTTRPYPSSAVNAIPVRVNIDGRPGVVALHDGQVAPVVMSPLPDPTFFPNRFDDITPRGTGVTCLNTTGVDGSGDCTLREAVIKANATAGTDNITLQAGTYQLSIAKVVNDCSAKFGALYINDSVNITGAGQNSTIIQAGTTDPTTTPGTSGDGVDFVMAVNEDLATANCPVTNASASISSLTLKFGKNNGTNGNFDGDGGCMEFDTGSSGNATLSLTNVTLTNCSTTDGNGGGIAIFNASSGATGGTGQPTISSSTIQNNTVHGANGRVGNGGGIWVADLSRMSLSSSQVMNNKALQVVGAGKAVGGGIWMFSAGSGSRQTVIHGGTISGNQSSGLGGGIDSVTNLLIDQGAGISGNTAGTDGGGIFYNATSPDSGSFSKIAVTGNTATGNGGGFEAGNTTGPVTIAFSRFAGNTAAAGSNLRNIASTVTATNNWWGTNNAASTISTVNAGTTTFDPFIVLTHSGSAQKIRINQSSTLTGDMSKDNHGTAVGLANLDRIIGLPITFDGAVLGTIPQAQPETLNANAQATATFNAGGTSGFGTANATVDQAVVPVNSNLIASATESGTTATITTVGAHGYSTGEFVRISGVGVAGYNSSPATQVFAILSTPTATTFTYTANASGLGPSSGGTANASIVILEPPSITKSFGPKTIQTTGGTGPGAKASTITFSLTNGNVIPIDSSFTDNLPTVGGAHPGSLVVASTPNVVNNCGGSVTATAGTGTISFANAALPIGTCTIKVDVSSTVDDLYSNSVTIDSTDAGNGNTSSDTLNVIDPPHITKSFGQASIQFGATTSLTITVNSTNQNQTLSAITFTDTLPNAAPGTLVVATPNNLSNNCSGTATATAGSGSVSLASSSLAPGASCTVSLNVQGTAVGAANNSVTASDTTAGTGNTSTALETVIKADTTTTVTSSANPSVFGQSVTFTATVSPVPGVGTPTGTVTFLDGGSPIGTGTLSGGIATFTTSALAVGNHTITTNYGGDGNFNGSTGSLTGNPQVVNKANTATTVTSSVNPSVFGQSVTFTATVSAVAPGSGTPTGTVTFLDGGSPIGTGTLSGGVATFTTSALAVGNHIITTNYGGDGNFNGSTGSLTGNPQVVNKANTSTTVTSSLNPSVFGQSVTFTATVSAVAPGAGTPTGTVTFLDGGSPIGTGTLSGGIATFTTSALAVGNHTITTSYGGDGNFNGSTGSLTGNPQVVNKADTTTTVTSSVNPSVFGQSVTFTATVSPVAPGAGTPTGTVTFLDGGSPIGTGTLSGGIATFATSALTAGNHTITTSYGGDGNFNGSTGSLTGNPQVVNKADTTTTVSSSVNPSVFGQSVTFTATVSPVAPGAGTPTGTVTFLDGGSPIGTGTLSGGIATFTTSALAVGNHTITTSYGGDGNFNGSTGSLTGNPQVVNKADTTTTVTSSVNPSVFGQSVTFTATVSAVAPGSGTPTGTVTFLDGGSPIGTGTLSGGIATFTTSALAVGNHTITTTYGGDGNFNGSTGSLTGNPQVVNKANSATTVTSSQNPSALGQSVTFTATVSAVAPGAGTPTGTVTFLDGGNPIGTGTLSGGVATFTTSALAAGNHTITTTYGGDGNFNGSNGSLTGNPQVVVAPPSIAKAFNPTTIALNGTTTLTLTITNPAANTVAEAGVAFTDNLPANLVVATPNGLSNTCGGTPTATAGSGTISLTGGTIAVNSSCTVSVNVTSSVSGSYTNTTGNVSSTNGGTGNTATAHLSVGIPPSIAKQFTLHQIPLNGTTTVTFTIQNPNTSLTLTGVAFTDTLPAGLVVATPNNLSNTCGGTATATGGSGSISLSGGTLAANASCTVKADVQGTTAGGKTNSVTVTSNEGGTGNTATDSITVVGPPGISKAFGAASIPLNGSTSLQFTLQNSNTGTTLTGVGFSDTLPAGLVIATPNGLTGSCGGGTITATQNTNLISLSGASLTASSSCTFSVNVTGTTAGSKTNTSGNVTSTEGGTGGTAQATIHVQAPPSIAKAFNPASIAPNGTSTLTFTITNPAANADPENGVAFTDNLPANVVVATPNGLSNNCGGTATATAGSGTISLTGGTIPVGSSCTVSVNVTSSVPGTYNNTSGAVSSTNGGTGNTASATLKVATANLSITKTHSGNFPRGSSGNNYTITVSNSASAGPTTGTVTVTDTLPNVPNTLVPTAMSGTGWTCNLGTLTCTRSDVLAAGSSYPPITLTVTVPQNIQANVTNSATVSGGGDPNSHTANDPTHIGPPLQISGGAGSLQVGQGGAASMDFTVDSSAGEGTINMSFTGAVPPGVKISFTPGSTNQLTTKVTMTVTATPGSASLIPLGTGRTPPMYAAFFPVLGLAGLMLGRKRNKTARLRLAVLLAGLVLLLAVVGCGGTRTGPPVINGNFPLSVTVSSPTTGDSASTSVTVQVL